MVVEDVGEVDFRGGFRRAAVERGGEVEHHRVGGLHIGGTAAPQHAVFGMSVGDFFANQRIAGSSHFGGKLSMTGTVSRCPAKITRLGLPKSVLATTVSP